MSNEKRKLTWGDWYLVVIGVGVAFALMLSVLGKFGLVDFPPPREASRPEIPRFDVQECLSRNAFRIRRADPLISDEMLNGDVARACVLEQQGFEGW